MYCDIASYGRQTSINVINIMIREHVLFINLQLQKMSESGPGSGSGSRNKDEDRKVKQAPKNAKSMSTSAKRMQKELGEITLDPPPNCR